MLKFENIQDSLNLVLEFIKPHLSLANSHATNFIKDHYWNTLLSEEIQQQLLQLSQDELSTLPFSAHSPGSKINTCDNCVNQMSKDFDSLSTQGRSHILSCSKSVSKNEYPGIDQSSQPQRSSETSKEEGCVDLDRQTDCCSSVDYQVSQEEETTAGHGLQSKTGRGGLNTLCQEARKCTIEGLNLSVPQDALLSDLGVSCGGAGQKVFIGTFMNQKKRHEVEEMSRICSVLAMATVTDLIIDVGSGKGYLGNHLYLQHDKCVLGVDAVMTNTTSAERRMNILGKQWDGLTRNAAQQQRLTKKEKKKMREAMKSKTKRLDDDFKKCDLSEVKPTSLTTNETQGENQSVGADSSEFSDGSHSRHPDLTTHVSKHDVKKCKTEPKYVPLTMFIDKTTDFSALAKTHFPELFASSQLKHEERTMGEARSEMTKNDFDHRNNLNLLLTGLHTCGDLASNSLALFVTSPEMKTVCSVGCCYHLLSEEFQEQASEKLSGSHGFPKSQLLRGRGVSLGTSARNLACQAVHRMAQTQSQLQGERFYPRALLEVLVSEVCTQGPVVWKGLRNLEQRTTSTQDYLRQACLKLGISDQVSDATIEEYVRRHADEKSRLAAFVQLRAVLAPVIETLILLDRACYLLEQESVSRVFLVQMFDPIISPRCYGLVAFK